MNHLTGILASIALGTLPAHIWAKSVTHSFPFDKIPGQIRLHNPTLAAARAELAVAEARRQQSGRLANPDASAEVRPNVKGREFSMEIGLEQKFPLTKRLSLEKAVTQTLVDQVRAEIANAERLLIAEAQSKAVEWLHTRNQQSLQQAQEEIASELAESIAKRAKLGEASPLDAGQAKLETAKLQFSRKETSAKMSQFEIELKRLLGIASEGKITITGELESPRPMAAASQHAVQRPDLTAKQLQIKQAESQWKLEEANRWEDASFGGFLEFAREEDAGAGMQNDAMLGLRFSIPWPLHHKNEGKIAEAKATMQKNQAESAALEFGITHEIAAARSALRQAESLVTEVSQKLLPMAEEQVKQTQNAWQNAQVGLAELLRSRDQLLTLKIARLSALRDWHLAWIQHQSAVGNQFNK